MTEQYFQCVLEKPMMVGIATTVTYLPRVFSTVGCMVRLKYKGGWDTGWTVVSVGKQAFSEDLIDLRAAQTLLKSKLKQ